MSAGPHETSVIEHEVRVAAPPETVFAYFTDPSRFVQWMGAEATLDPRPGGVFRVVFRASPQVLGFLSAAAGSEQQQATGVREETNVVLGEFVDVDPCKRIAFTWGYEREFFAMPPQSSSVEVSLTVDGEETVVRLAHRRLPATATTFHRAGWDHYLPRLVTVAGGGDPGPDPLQADTQ
jgi:uncharacterized protein YndB with AHSA1/START domain